jgi:predicted metal-dependent peptidase
MSSSLKAISAARYYACQRAPYLAGAILSMVPREVPLGAISKDGTLAMNDEGLLLYEAAAFTRWSTPEAGSVLVHEVLHWLRKHGARFIAVGGQHKEHWQFAVDYEINDDLQAMKLPLPDGGGLHPRDENLPDGKLAEWYYQELLKRYPPSKPPPKPAHTKCKCGGGSAAGVPLACEPTADPGARSDAEADVIRVQVAGAVKSHAQSHGAGSVPAGLLRWADELTKPPVVHWAQVLARVVKARVAFRRGATHSTYTKINRRQGGLGYTAGSPRLTKHVAKKANIVMAIDTSGSMGKADVERAVVEAGEVLKQIGQSARLLTCDAAVHEDRTVRTLRDIVSSIKGGGGTDFRPVFRALEKKQPTPELLIFFTDGGGYAPSEPPKGIHVIWILIGAHRCRPMLPGGGSVTYGDFIEVQEP